MPPDESVGEDGLPLPIRQDDDGLEIESSVRKEFLSCFAKSGALLVAAIGNGRRDLSKPQPSGAAEPAPAVAAATVREPQRGCPAPTAAERRASQVLRTFSTDAQWRQWERTGTMRLVGNATGRAYVLHHRGVAASLGLRHVLVRASNQREVCVWDDRVPPEEEALGIKLAVEHREHWLLG